MEQEARGRLQGAMGAVRDGDRAAFDAVFSALWPACRDFARRLVPDDHAAEDVAQGALCTLFNRSPHFDDSRSVLAWAFTLTAWEARTWNRRVGRRRERGDEALASATTLAASPEQRAGEAERLRLALEAVHQLDDDDRKAIARALTEDTPRSATDRKRKQRALDRLKDALGALLRPPRTPLRPPVAISPSPGQEDPP